MTRYHNIDRHYYEVLCDVCNTQTMQSLDKGDSDLEGGWLWVGVKFDKENNGHVCPTCRYAGHPSETIVRTLQDLRLSIGQVKANISDNGYRIARIHAGNQYSRGERTHALHFQKKAYHSLASIESTINLLVSTLEK